MKYILTNEAAIPPGKNDEDWCYDFFAYRHLSFLARSIARFDLGVAVALPHNVGMQLCTRSSMAWKETVDGVCVRCGIFVIGGVIDPGYRGELKVVLANISGKNWEIMPGMAICQGKLEYVVPDKLEQLTREEWDSLEKTLRGNKGFGSTDSLL